jgi:hypothetical protein
VILEELTSLSLQGTRQLELTVASSALFDPKSTGVMNPASIGRDPYTALNSSRHTSPRLTQVKPDRNYPSTSFPTFDQRRVSQPMNSDQPRGPLGSHPYDPITGFVLFYDFVLHLPSNTDQCRLITCLHHPQSGLGAPSQLPAGKCESYVDETSGDLMAAAIIGVKQGVPRFDRAVIVFFYVQVLQLDVHLTNY